MIGRRFFLGRAAVGAAAAPALVRQAEATIIGRHLPTVDTESRVPVPEERYVGAMPTAVKPDPVMRMLRLKARDQERHEARVDRIRSRTIQSMRSWSPSYMEIQARDTEDAGNGQLQAIYDQMRALRGSDEGAGLD